MREAETVLNVIRDRGQKGLPLEDLYRQLFNPDLYLRAYRRISGNDGAMTRGVTDETVDGMSLEKINTLIEEVRNERIRWTPVRRTYIPKKGGKKRPLGIPTWKDKLLQEVMRSLLEAYYEPRFSRFSHGFRSGRGCHTALVEISHIWKGTKWFVEGDIKGCFDNIDHEMLLSILREKIHDNRFVRLIENLLKAGYLEEWRYYPTLSGTPQGGIISPILSNIYLDRLDKFVEQELLTTYNRKKERKVNPDHHAWTNRAYRYRQIGDLAKAKEASKQQHRLPYGDPYDPEYRRLCYVRYADDFLLGFAGPKGEAETIKEKLRQFLQEKLKLEMSPEKTLITHATTEAARFLGYNILIQQEDTKRDRNNIRSVNGVPALRIPEEVVEECCTRYQKDAKPIHRVELTRDDDFSIVSQYQSEYRGYVQYYALAANIAWMNKVHWTMKGSLLKTLANKHKTSVAKEWQRLQAKVQTDYGPRSCLEVRVSREGKEPLIARFGGIPLRRQQTANLRDFDPHTLRPARNELLKRLLADECEICSSTEDVQVHHIRKLTDLEKKGRKEKPFHVQIMAARRRKTLVVCRDCHWKIHTGKI
jgi:group II intron reverse transcriptase/maturase